MRRIVAALLLLGSVQVTQLPAMALNVHVEYDEPVSNPDGQKLLDLRDTVIYYKQDAGTEKSTVVPAASVNGGAHIIKDLTVSDPAPCKSTKIDIQITARDLSSNESLRTDVTSVTKNGSVPCDQLAAPVLVYPITMANKIDPGKVKFSWNSVAGASKYSVVIHDTSKTYNCPTDYVLCADVTGTSVEVTLEANKTYEWWVQTYNSSGVLGTDLNGTQIVTGPPIVVPDTTPPKSPSNTIISKYVDVNTVEVAWPTGQCNDACVLYRLNQTTNKWTQLASTKESPINGALPASGKRLFAVTSKKGTMESSITYGVWAQKQ